MATFRRKTIKVEAFQMTLEHREKPDLWPQWLRDARLKDRDSPWSLSLEIPDHDQDKSERYAINTTQGWYFIAWGDWIAQDGAGKLYAYRPDIFADVYVPDDDPAPDNTLHANKGPNRRIFELECHMVAIVAALSDEPLSDYLKETARGISSDIRVNNSLRVASKL